MMEYTTKEIKKDLQNIWTQSEYRMPGDFKALMWKLTRKRICSDRFVLDRHTEKKVPGLKYKDPVCRVCKNRLYKFSGGTCSKFDFIPIEEGDT